MEIEAGRRASMRQREGDDHVDRDRAADRERRATTWVVVLDHVLGMLGAHALA